MPKVERLRVLRERAVLTQEELAQKAGVAASTISKLEIGQAVARPATVRKLAAALAVQPSELLGQDGG